MNIARNNVRLLVWFFRLPVLGDSKSSTYARLPSVASRLESGSGGSGMESGFGERERILLC